MKKTALLGLLIAVLSIPTFAAERVNGYYITSNNETLRCEFLIPMKFWEGEPDFESMQWKVKYLDNLGKKVKLKPAFAKGFGFSLNGKDYTFHSYKNSINVVSSIFIDNTFIYLRLKSDGYLKIYQYYQTQNSGGYYNAGTGMVSAGVSYTVERMCFKKGDGELTKIRKLFFKKDMSAYLADDVELATKITNKEYRFDDVERIVAEYNAFYAQQSK